MDIEYDPQKCRKNKALHGISLADVEAVFYDPAAITIEDRDHDEQRLLTLGVDQFGRTLVVCYTWRATNIRIISARKAEPHERKMYEGKR
jgi:uncharacterized DUF497 family protein